jgi:hypothetical protein
MNEKASVTTFPDGTVLDRPGARNYQVQGNLVQQLPGNFRAGASADYFSDITINQLLAYDARTSRNRQSLINANVSGSIVGWQLGAQYDRRELFYPNGTSNLRGGQPRVTLSHAESPIATLPIYWGVETEGVGIKVLRNTAKGAVVDESRNRFDVRPTVRVPLSKLTWLNVTSSVAWRYTWWSESLDAKKKQIEEPISRQYFEMQTQIVGPVFGRIFDTPGLGYAQRWKHVIEPSISFSRTTAIDEKEIYDRIIPNYDSTDTIVGGVTSVRYALTNRLYAKKGEGAAGRVREVLSFIASQSYYTSALAAARDQRLRTSFSGEGLSKFSPVELTLRFSPTQTNLFDIRGDYDTQFNAFRQLSASATLRIGEWLDGTASWSQQRFIADLPGYNVERNLRHSLNARVSARSDANKYGAAYDFRYDIRQGGIMEQSINAHYSAQCCGIGVEFMTSKLPTFGTLGGAVDRRFNVTFNLAGIGSFSDFFGAFGADPYRR